MSPALLFLIHVWLHFAKAELLPLDLKEWTEGSEEQREQFAVKWDEALHYNGFLMLVNHGLPADVLERISSATKSFFDLPLEDKIDYYPDERLMSGYHPPGWSQRDINEDYQIFAKKDINNLHPFLSGPVSDYWTELRKLQYTLLEISDVALGVPRGSFFSALSCGDSWDEAEDGGNCKNKRDFDDEGYVASLRLSNYFSQEPNEDGKIPNRIGAHTDYLMYTILKTDSVPGLEVARGEQQYNVKTFEPTFDDDQWDSVIPEKDSLVINSGDVLRFFTNGWWKSAYHRVIGSTERRLSLVFFTGPKITCMMNYRFTGCQKCDDEQDLPKVSMSIEEYQKKRHRVT